MPRQSTKIHRVCEVCGNDFSFHPSQLKYRQPRFCSQQCHGLASRAGLGRVAATCQWCGKGFQADAGNAKRGGGKYCSPECYWLAKKKDRRDWYVIEDRGYITPCWIWQGPKDHGGYGSAGSDGPAHRFFYERAKGKVPDGLEMDHLCRQHDCVNPDHLEPVTTAVNVQRGLSAKLTMDAARMIRVLYAAKTHTQYELADMYGVHQRQIHNIVTGKTWRE